MRVTHVGYFPAEGAEAENARLRRSDPEVLFDRMAKLMARGYVQKLDAEKPE
jgi:hypothetical protein